MKIKHILSYAALSALLCACAVDEGALTGRKGDGEEANNQTAEGGIISVSASVPDITGTKSGVLIYDNDGLINAGDSISLYAFANFNGSSDIVSVLDNVPMWYDGSSWTYKPIQHWLPSADRYAFYGVHPHAQGRLSPDFKFPSSKEHYVIGIQERVYPMYETWGGEDYAKGNIIHKLTRDLYLSNATPDLMFGGCEVAPSAFGETVNLPLSHACSAVRFSIRNLSESPFTVTNWYLTGLLNHTDMAIYIIDCPEEYEPLRFMTILQNKEIDSLHISTFGGDEQDLLYLAGANGTPTICADGGVNPGEDGYYEYILLSSPLKEVGETYNMSHSHAADGSIIYNINGRTYHDRDSMQMDSHYRTSLQTVKNLYPPYYGNYTRSIFWGPAHGLCTDNFFMPLAYKHGVQIIDFNRDQIRGDSGDFQKLIHQFECRSYVMTPSGSSTLKANGGIYMPISVDNLARLYSPYFLNAAKFSSVTGDWKEAMDPALETGASVFRCTIDDTESNFYSPVLVDSCVARMNRAKGEYTPSVKGGDLANILNDWGYILMYPQKLDSLVFNFHTSVASGAVSCDSTTGAVSGESYIEATSNILHSFNPKDYTPGGEWLSGYQYDYIITVSSSSISVQLDVEPWNEREIYLE